MVTTTLKNISLIFVGALLTSSVAIAAPMFFARNSHCAALDPNWTPRYSNIVGYWKLNDSHGSGVVADSSPVGTNTGAVTGGSISLGATGKVGTAASFNGTAGDYIKVPSSASVTFAGAITMAAWVYPISTGNYQTLVCNSDGSTSNRNYAMFLSGAGTNYLYVAMGGSEVGNFTLTTSWAYNAWNHIVVTADGTNITVYVNGTLSAQVANTNVSTNITSWAGTPTALYLGTQGVNYPLDGTLDEVTIWNTALNAAQVAALYGRQKAAPPSACP